MGGECFFRFKWPSTITQSEWTSALAKLDRIIKSDHPDMVCRLTPSQDTFLVYDSMVIRREFSRRFFECSFHNGDNLRLCSFYMSLCELFPGQFAFITCDYRSPDKAGFCELGIDSYYDGCNWKRLNWKTWPWTDRNGTAPALNHESCYPPLPPSSPFKLAALPGRGIGVVATRDIQRGERILHEKPLLTYQELGAGTPNRGQTEQLRRMVAALPHEDKLRFWHLSDCHPHRSIDDPTFICMTNSFEAGPLSALCPIASRFNHSCRPNVTRVWMEEVEELRIHASRAIGEGEELCIGYTHLHNPRGLRQRELSGRYRFTCSCGVCSLAGEELRVSDANRSRIALLERRVLELAQAGTKTAALSCAQEYLDLINLEYCNCPQMAKTVYYDMFQIHLFHGDVEGARGAMRGMNGCHRLIGTPEGELGEYESLEEDPRRHPIWEMRGFGRSCPGKQAAGLSDIIVKKPKTKGVVLSLPPAKDGQVKARGSNRTPKKGKRWGKKKGKKKGKRR